MLRRVDRVPTVRYVTYDPQLTVSVSRGARPPPQRGPYRCYRYQRDGAGRLSGVEFRPGGRRQRTGAAAGTGGRAHTPRLGRRQGRRVRHEGDSLILRNCNVKDVLMN